MFKIRSHRLEDGIVITIEDPREFDTREEAEAACGSADWVAESALVY